MNYLDYIAHYKDVVMHAYLRYKDYTNYLLYIEPDTCMQAIKELQTEAQFGFSVNHLKRLLLADGLDRLEERIQIMEWEMTDKDYRCLLQIKQTEIEFYKERMDFFTRTLGDKLGQEYATRLYKTLEAITWNTTCILEMRAKLLGYVTMSQKQQAPSTDVIETEDALNRPEIQVIFSKAISKGLMDAKGNWFESASLLAIFCQRIFFKHLIKRYPDLNPDGTPKKEWKPFQDYFRVDGKPIDFRDAFKRAKKNIPKKLFLIDEIIEETPQAQQDRLKDHS